MRTESFNGCTEHWFVISCLYIFFLTDKTTIDIPFHAMEFPRRRRPSTEETQ